MKLFKKISSIAMAAVLSLCVASNSFADKIQSSDKAVITLGANLNSSQKKDILDYFGTDESFPNIIYINNKMERKYLTGVAPDEQIGHVTMSSSYVTPTNDGGINVKTSNITWVTSSMIASTLLTAGVENANVVAAAPFPVSGTGALTGIIVAFEKSTGETLTEDKKKIANKELVTTGNLADEIGKDKATGIINDSKKEVIKDKLKSDEDIEKAVKDIANQYNVTLSTGDINIVVNLLKDISAQNYSYSDIKNTLDNVSALVRTNLKNNGENIDIDGLLSKAKEFLSSNKKAQEFFNQFDDSKLSDSSAVITTTTTGLNDAKQIITNTTKKVQDSGIIDRIINFIKSIFN